MKSLYFDKKDLFSLIALHPRTMSLQKVSARRSGQQIQMNVTLEADEIFASLTLEAACPQSKHTIVNISDEDGKIVKMFSWYLLQGANITTIGDLDANHTIFVVNMLDQHGNLLFSSRLTLA